MFSARSLPDLYTHSPSYWEEETVVAGPRTFNLNPAVIRDEFRGGEGGASERSTLPAAQLSQQRRIGQLLSAVAAGEPPIAGKGTFVAR